eukprot:gb/GECG01013910.1/.p1 GENE.gb/GECG01013910.1/~~gb/GECG01013910.1/.p1  ORF type:complete len:413 (+),score=81.21 gb/GECG01013910.1/:1-1239(+)
MADQGDRPKGEPPVEGVPQEALHPTVPVDQPEGLETPRTQSSGGLNDDDNDDSGASSSHSEQEDDEEVEEEEDGQQKKEGSGQKKERRGSTGPTDDPDAPPAIMEYLRRGRRSQIYAPPVELEEGWQPRVVEKDAESKKRILDVISDNILFRDHDKQERDIIVDAMELKSFEADEVIIRQGDLGDFFYVLDSGHCDIFVEGVGKVMDVNPGGSFGELALMYNAPRAATVIATEPSKAWALDQETFKKTIMSSTLQRRKRHEDFLRKVPILNGLLDYERMTIADALQTKYFSAGENIITEGSKGETFYIIESGEVKCTKEGIDHEVSPRLGTGDYFGELALISNSLRAATVTAVTDVKCQALDRHTFKRLLGPLERTFKRNMETYEATSVPESDDDEGPEQYTDRDGLHEENQ